MFTVFTEAGSTGHQPKSGPPRRRTIGGRFDDESRCYSVIVAVARDSARMTVIRRESGPSRPIRTVSEHDLAAAQASDPTRTRT